MVSKVERSNEGQKSDKPIYIKLSSEKDLVGQVAMSRISGPLPKAHPLNNISTESGETLINAFYRFIGVKSGSTPIVPIREKPNFFSLKDVGELEGDVSWGFRGLWDLFQALGFQSAGSGVVQVAAETTLLSGVGGCLGWLAARERLQKASQGVVQDEYTKTEASADMVTSGAKAASGLVMGFHRQAALVCFARGIPPSIHSADSAGRIAGISGFMGTTLTGAFLGLYTAWGALSFKELSSFVNRYRGDSYEESIEFFREEFNITPKTTYADLQKQALDEKVDVVTLLRKEGVASIQLYLKEAAEFLGKKQEDIEIKPIDVQAFLDTKGSIRMEDIMNQLSDWDPDWQSLFVEGFPTTLEVLGLYIACRKQKDLKEAEIKRCIGGEAFHLLDKHLLQEIEEVDPADKTLFLEKIQEGYWKEGKWQVLFLGTLAVSTTVLALAATSYFVVNPVLALSTAILNVGIAFVTISMDASVMVKDAMAEGEVKLVDKVVTNANLLLGVGCLIAIIILSSSTMGILPAAIAIGIATIWVVVSTINVVTLYLKEHRYKEMHMSQEELTNRMLALKNKISLEASSKVVETQREKVAYSFLNTIGNSFISDEKKDELYNRFYEVIKVERIDTKEVEEFIEILKVWKEQEQVIKDAIEDSFAFFPDKVEKEPSNIEKFASRIKDFMESMIHPKEEATI
jgi:hypothetical protein